MNDNVTEDRGILKRCLLFFCFQFFQPDKQLKNAKDKDAKLFKPRHLRAVFRQRFFHHRRLYSVHKDSEKQRHVDENIQRLRKRGKQVQQQKSPDKEINSRPRLISMFIFLSL